MMRESFETSESPTLAADGQAQRLTRDTLRRERAMRRFFEQLRVEHEVFAASIEGMADSNVRSAYAARLISRLMFLYFIQSKRLLDDDPHYLRRRLARHTRSPEHVCERARAHEPQTASFYRSFLLRLFHEAFGEEQRTPELVALVGRVPRFVGGLFPSAHSEDEGRKEDGGRNVEIADAAFARLFDFFDRYQWQLAARPAPGERELTPDVLGYIFERQINRKQLGAYFTKQDVADYISQNSIIPALFDRARRRAPASFAPDAPLWQLLREHPERYIYAALKRGVIDEHGLKARPLPMEIAAGVGDVHRRADWNAPASEREALAGETWREYAARHGRCLDLRERMRAGEFVSINQLITHNLNISQFAADALAVGHAEFVEAFYEAIAGGASTVAGETTKTSESSKPSGTSKRNETSETSETSEPNKTSELNETRETSEASKRNETSEPSETSEAVISILDPACGSGEFLFAALRVLEPLLTICLRRMDDFAASAEAARPGQADDSFRRVLAAAGRAPARSYFILETIISGNLYGVDIMPEATEVCRLRLFLRLLAETDDGASLSRAEPPLLPSLSSSIRTGNALVGFANAAEAKRAPAACRASRDAFHWAVEFPHVVEQRSGFDVIIGNPPYVEPGRARLSYRPAKELYRTESAGNLYAFMVERALALLSTEGSLSMILPLSAFSTRRMKPLVELIRERRGTKWISHFGWRPGKLFEGVNIPLSILLVRGGAPDETYTTRFNKWYSEFRPSLFPTLQYTRARPAHLFEYVVPKLGTETESRILAKLFGQKKSLRQYQAAGRKPEARLFYRNTGGLYWRIFTDFQPFFAHEGRAMSSSTEATISFRDAETLGLATGILNSNLYWFFYVACSSFHHVNPSDILEFPVDFEAMDEELKAELRRASAHLMEEMRERSRIRSRVHRGGRTSRIQTFFPTLSKPLNDRIDRLLARSYGLTDEEIDYIINYDIKYRARSDQPD